MNTVTAVERQEMTEWYRKDQQAYAAICLQISDDYIVYTYDMTTSKGVWDALMTIFEASGPIGIINTRHEFFRTFAQEGENMEEHIRKLHGLQQTLHTMGELISDRDFSNTLLTSLPKSWSTFIMAVNAGLLTLTSDALIACILEEYKSRQAGSGGTALKGAEQDKKSKRFGATKGKCRNCGKKGHWVKDCWEPGGDKEGQAPKWWKPQEKAKQTKERSIDNNFAFTSTETCAAAISTSNWLANSAATTHIALNRSHFMDYISEPNEIEGIAPGSLEEWRRGSSPSTEAKGEGSRTAGDCEQED